MDDATRDLYRERGLHGAQTAGTRPCLVVIDLTYGFTEPDSPLGCEAQEAVRATAQLLAAARAAGIPRVFTRIEYDAAGLAAARGFLQKVPALHALTPGSRWSAIDAAVAPREDEPVLTKYFASGFAGTPLAALLTAQRCDTVVLAGASTSGCVRATAVDAMQHGHSVVVPRSAVADRARGPHDAALFDVAAKYGEVVELDVALALLAAAAPAEAEARGR